MVYRVRLVIDGEDYAVELHRSALAAAHEAATWARRHADAQVILETLCGPDDRDEA